MSLVFVLILPQAKPVGRSSPLKNPLSPLSVVAYLVQAFDWSGGKETETTQDILSLPQDAGVHLANVNARIR